MVCYTLFTGYYRWRTNNLTYQLINYPSSINAEKIQVDQVIEKAFKSWQNVANISIKRADNIADVEGPIILLRFGSGGHYCSSSFDGREGTYAHAFLPPLGHIHFDDDELWSIGLSDKRKCILLGSITIQARVL